MKRPSAAPILRRFTNYSFFKFSITRHFSGGQEDNPKMSPVRRAPQSGARRTEESGEGVFFPGLKSGVIKKSPLKSSNKKQLKTYRESQPGLSIDNRWEVRAKCIPASRPNAPSANYSPA